MQSKLTGRPTWTTSSFGDTVDTEPMERSALGRHLVLCRDAHGRLFDLRCMAESMHDFMAPRLVTTLVAVTLLIGLASTFV